jgi:hypothetical protein
MGGIDLTTVKELMGHSDISMTMRYSHLTPKHKRSAVEILDKRGEMDTYESQKVVAFTQGSSESL